MNYMIFNHIKGSETKEVTKMFELPDHSLEHGCYVIQGIAVPCIMLF